MHCHSFVIVNHYFSPLVDCSLFSVSGCHFAEAWASTALTLAFCRIVITKMTVKLWLSFTWLLQWLSCHCTLHLPLLHLPLFIIALLPLVEWCLCSVAAPLIDRILCIIFYVIMQSLPSCYTNALPWSFFCHQWIVAFPCRFCCLISVSRLPFYQSPSQHQSNVAFCCIAVTANWMLVFTYLLLHALALTVISLCYVAALPLLMFFFTNHWAHHCQTTAVSTMVIATCCCFFE